MVTSAFLLINYLNHTHKRNYTTSNFENINNVIDSKINLNNGKSITLLMNSTSINNTILSILWIETKAIQDSKIVLNNMQ